LLSKNLKFKIYRTIILPVVTYGCKTWLLAQREELGCGCLGIGDEVTGEWRKLHNELNDLYCLPNIVWVIKSRRLRWAGHVARMGERVLVGKLEGKRPLGRPRHSWEDNFKIYLQEMGVGVWTGSSWLRIGTGGRHL
jgi:hypothetical protein